MEIGLQKSIAPISGLAEPILTLVPVCFAEVRLDRHVHLDSFLVSSSESLASEWLNSGPMHPRHTFAVLLITMVGRTLQTLLREIKIINNGTCLRIRGQGESYECEPFPRLGSANF